MLVLPIPVLFLFALARFGKVLVPLVIFVRVFTVGAIFILIPLMPITMLAVVVWLVLISASLSILVRAVLCFLPVPPLFARLASVDILRAGGALLPTVLSGLAKERVG